MKKVVLFLGLIFSTLLLNGQSVFPRGVSGNASSVTNGVYTTDTAAMLAKYARKLNAPLTGVPTAPTAAVGTNTTQLATTAFVLANSNNLVTTLQSLGSPVKVVPLLMSTIGSDHGVMVDGQQKYEAVYIPYAMTITGVGFTLAVAGNYTSDNYNGVGLFSYSGGNLTLVASSTDDGNIWKATADTWTLKAFSTPYNASPGVYYVAAMYNNSAQTAAPEIYWSISYHLNASRGLGMTNSAFLTGTEGTFTTFTNRTAAQASTSNRSYGLFLY